MFMFSKKIAITLASIFFMLSISATSHAALIKQDILATLNDGSKGALGLVTMEIDDSFIGLDMFLDTAFDDEAFSLAQLSILGISMLEIFDFNASIYAGNIFTGLESLVFDVEQLAGPGFSISATYDTLMDSSTNTFDVFNGLDLVVFGTIELGDVVVELSNVLVVDSPTSFTLVMLLICFGLVGRRKLQQ